MKKKKPRSNTVNILGTQYQIITDVDGTLLPQGWVGSCDVVTKTITLKFFAEGELGFEHCEKYLRHELIHAFFYESGLDEYYQNEMLTDWLAMQFPKLADVMRNMQTRNI